ncbi:MAG: hypothetical protein H0W12_10990 [Chitinophagaceae bacterium]|nr:hypothetical protein [Chitinophagaceae bacterium]
MQFTLTIPLKEKRFKITVERIYQSEQIERYEIAGGNKKIILRNNRPQLKNKKSKKKPEWKLESGTIKDPQAFALTLLQIEKKIEEIDNPGQVYIHPKNL